MSIKLHAFRPTVEKVYHVDVHPTQPWIASSDGGDNVVVWDWEHRQVPPSHLLVPQSSSHSEVAVYGTCPALAVVESPPDF